MSLSDYYHAELAYYRALAQEVAERFPEVAHLVSERRGDPAIERVLQGASLLTSRLRYRLDDDFPEVIYALFDAMWPQYLRPYPAFSLLQFTPLPNVLRQSQTIARGTSISSRPVDGIECPFQTAAPVDLHPLEVTNAGLSRPHPADLQLRLSFEMTGGVSFDTVNMPRVRIHLLGDREIRYTLYHWLVYHSSRLSVLDADGELRLTLRGDAVQPAGFGTRENLCEFQETMLPGMRLLQEYFAFPDKFLAVDICGLDQVPAGILESSFSVVFHLGTPREEKTRVEPANFALGCVPVVNLSLSEQVDVPVKEGATEYRLVAPDNGEIYTVDKVGAYDSRTGDWIDYPPLFTRRRTRLMDRRPCYQLLHRTDGVEGLETFLAIRDAEGKPLQPPAELLNVHLTYSNGNKPLRLGVGDIDVPTSSSPQFVQFSNLTPIAAPAPQSLGKDTHWELLTLFAMHSVDLMGVTGLRLVLERCHDARTSEQVLPRIVDVQTRESSRLHEQTVVPVTQVTVVLDDQSFIGQGEMYLFGSVLSRLFAERPDIFAFSELTVRGQPSGVEFHFRG
jgi:type VI secretion system protein ImpG